MASEHTPEDIHGSSAEPDNRLLHANEQLTLNALHSLEQAEASEQRYLDQNEANKMLVQKQHQLRYLASELILTEQRERKRLAGQLHDYLAQLLVFGRLKISSLRSRSRATDPVEVGIMGEIDEIFVRSLAYTRTLMAELSPPVLYELGLPDALKWLAEEMGKFGLQVDLHFSSEPASLRDDQRVLLYQSVRELLLNVVKHAQTSQASLALSVEGQDCLRLVVRDEGIGFDVNSQQANPVLGPHLGLFSIRERMVAMGGEFHMESVISQGTTVTLTLPLGTIVKAESPSPAMHTPHRRHGDPPSKAINTRSVLLVDDHAIIRKGLRTILDDHEDLTVIGEAANGAEAVSMAADLRPDVILMDINMPGMNGIDATKQIKAVHPDTIVIGLSVSNSTQVVEAMKTAGAAHFVSKEAAVEELYEAIAALT